MSEKIIIFDTTLRDGEQSPGATLNLAEKLEVARALRNLRVDVIEAGFPISSPGDFEAVMAVSKEIKGPIIAGLCRARKEDIDRAWEALQHADRPRIHTFLATSEIHREKKLRKSEEEIIAMAVEAVKRAKSYTPDVEFSAEDAGRTGVDYLVRVVTAVIDAGATTVNIPDTVGYSNPWQYGDIIATVMKTVPNVSKAVISVHCHNDLGLAVANSLAAVRQGARQVECTINGLGERAGNASLEEIVMNLAVRKDFYGFTTDIDTTELYRTSRLVSNLTGIVVQPNKAVVGRNAFAHEAGIHQDGVLKSADTYEIMRPENVGVTGTTMVLGKHSGRNAFKDRLQKLGYQLSPEALEKAFDNFKALCDKKKVVYDADLEALVEEQTQEVPSTYILDHCQITCGDKALPTATIRLLRGEEVLMQAGCGDGPVDAAYNVIKQLTQVDAKLARYEIRALTSGTDAVGEVSVTLEADGQGVTARGIDTDIVMASVKAFINAINKFEFRRQRGFTKATEPTPSL